MLTQTQRVPLRFDQPQLSVRVNQKQKAALRVMAALQPLVEAGVTLTHWNTTHYCSEEYNCDWEAYMGL